MTAEIVATDTPPLDIRPGSERPDADTASALLLFGVLGPPLLALLNLQLSYMMTPWACRTGNHVAMQIVTACIFVAVLLTGTGAALHFRRRWLEDTVISRPGFMAGLGMLESALLATVIAAQWLPNAFLSVCQ